MLGRQIVDEGTTAKLETVPVAGRRGCSDDQGLTVLSMASHIPGSTHFSIWPPTQRRSACAPRAGTRTGQNHPKG